jgi:hypothetical protein
VPDADRRAVRGGSTAREGLNNVRTQTRLTCRVFESDRCDSRGSYSRCLRRIFRASSAPRTDCCPRHQVSSRHPQVR